MYLPLASIPAKSTKERACAPLDWKPTSLIRPHFLFNRLPTLNRSKVTIHGEKLVLRSTTLPAELRRARLPLTMSQNFCSLPLFVAVSPLNTTSPEPKAFGMYIRSLPARSSPFMSLLNVQLYGLPERPSKNRPNDVL